MTRTNHWLRLGALACLGALASIFGCSSEPPKPIYSLDGATSTTGATGTTGTTATTGGAAACVAGQMMCAAGCTDVASDAANCGACGVPCAAPQVCSQGSCQASCSGGLTQCGQDCADTNTSAAHCGGCNMPCAAGQTCAGGVCGCAAGQSDCSGVCVDTLSDPANCGSCGNSCNGQACTAGQCASGTTGGLGGTSGTTTTGSGGATTTATTTGSGGSAAVSSTGGATSAGASSTTGGEVVPVGPCNRPVGSCSSPDVTVTSVDVGVSIARSAGTSDTDPIPLAIASMPSGGSLLAALGGSSVQIAQLDCADQIVGSPFSIPAIDLQDIIADDDGGVVLVTREATDGGQDNCGNGQLCGGTSSPCRSMWMVRFNNSGTVEWETEVTNLSSLGVAGYTNGARYVWWYQHHGRLAFSGTTYAAIFGVAITVNNGNCVDIHEGDRLQMVSSSGQLVSDGSLEVGMSHAWTSRILWDPRSNEFMASDATDNSCRIANPYGAQTIRSGSCDGELFNGDIVMATGGGYWNASAQSGTIHLVHTNGGMGDQDISAGSSLHPHLVTYGPNNMLLTWGSGGGQAAEVRSAGDGSVIGQFTVDVNDEPYHAYKAYDDGSVAFPALGGGSSAQIARVMPCN